MKTIVKILLGLLALIVIVIVVLLSYVKFGLPKVGDPPDLQVEITPERLERGAYLHGIARILLRPVWGNGQKRHS